MMMMMMVMMINYIIYCLTGRTQSVVINGKQSLRLSVTGSLVQGSSLAPFLLLIYILDHRPLSSIHIMCKYADDLSQLCPRRSSVTLDCLVEEYAHIQKWVQVNKLSINISKRKVIVFERLSLRNY